MQIQDGVLPLADGFQPVATGAVRPSFEWDNDTNSRKADQARDTQGKLLWMIEVLVRLAPYGRVSSSLTEIMVAADTAPVIEDMGPVSFENLTCCPVATRDGRLRLNFKADSLTDTATPSVSDSFSVGGF